VQEVEQAYHAGQAPVNAVEGFIRQILGWREYARGVYWHFMPEYLDRNHLEADWPLPDFFWRPITLACLPGHCFTDSIRHCRVCGK
jgi:deoxyribodipyrimidine photolyase-related protein